MAELRVYIDKGPWLATRIDNINNAIDGELALVADTKDFVVLKFPYTGFISSRILTLLAEQCDAIAIV